LDILIQLKTCYPAGYPTGKSDSHHLQLAFITKILQICFVEKNERVIFFFTGSFCSVKTLKNISRSNEFFKANQLHHFACKFVFTITGLKMRT